MKIKAGESYQIPEGAVHDAKAGDTVTVPGGTYLVDVASPITPAMARPKRRPRIAFVPATGPRPRCSCPNSTRDASGSCPALRSSSLWLLAVVQLFYQQLKLQLSRLLQQ